MFTIVDAFTLFSYDPVIFMALLALLVLKIKEKMMDFNSQNVFHTIIAYEGEIIISSLNEEEK